jgi:hypothetical protein
MVLYKYRAGCVKITLFYVRFEILMSVIMKNAISWDVMPCVSCKNQRFEGSYRLHHQGGKNQ